MGKHTPLPSDPIAKAAEKKRRFKVYQKDWKKKRRERDLREAIAKAKSKRDKERADAKAEEAARAAWRAARHYDLIGL
jgi:hypothetical protein